jgi:mercuric reductase
MKKQKTIEMQIQGMTCSHCESKVRNALSKVPGVSKVLSVDWKTGSARAEVEASINLDSLSKAVEEVGYKASIRAQNEFPKPAENQHTDLNEKALSVNHGKNFDLLIIGSGSAAFAAAIKATELGKTVGMIEAETIGGTCVNVGCIPSKTLIRAAETKHRIESSLFEGIEPGHAKLDFTRLVKEKDNLVSEMRGSKYESVLKDNPKITSILGRARFVNANTLEVGERKITGERILIATGSSPVIPNVIGLKESGYLTSKTALELQTLPESLIVLGGGYIALELAQLFARLGSKVTIVQRSEILSGEDHETSEWLGKYLKEEGIEVLNQTEVRSVSRNTKGLTIEAFRRGEILKLEAREILVATGRRPNTDDLNLEGIGVQVNPNGSIKVNSFAQTTQANIYAAGDVLDSPALVYVAAYEGNLAAENAITGNKRKTDYSTVPWVVFTDPQVSGVGLSEPQAKAQGIKYDVSFLTLDHVPRALAARDSRGFVKLLRKAGTEELLGARVLAPEGSELIMELSLILKYKIPLSEIASMFHPYLTLAEAVKLAALTFDKDVNKLSCCAT